MRAIQIAAPRKIAFVDAPMPTLQDGDVLVQCKYVGLCGSNMGQYSGEGVWGANYPYPVGSAGHENIGTIVESRCPAWKPGTLVLAQPEGYFGFAEFFRAKPPGIAALPPDAPDIPALIMAQPLSTVLRAMTQTENVINQRCAVIGAGPMGLIWIHLLRQLGARQVIATDVLDWRLTWAKRFGADAVIDASKEKVVDVVRELTGGQMLDFVVTASTAAEALASSVCLLKRDGRLFVFGMPHFNDQKFPWYAAFRSELKIINSVGPECAAFFQVATDMMLDGRAGVLGNIVTPRMPWDQAPKAFDMYADCARDSLKLVLEL
ncbi:MAG: zinc-binding dehydrogenase [Kiritimatiellaeota bacterium]|nr:zinc-binding dehydrogenase [Kiritimatiellota bacterium]